MARCLGIRWWGHEWCLRAVSEGWCSLKGHALLPNRSGFDAKPASTDRKDFGFNPTSPASPCLNENSMIAAFALLVASCATRLATASEQSPSDFTPGIQSRRRVGTGLTLEEERASCFMILTASEAVVYVRRGAQESKARGNPGLDGGQVGDAQGAIQVNGIT